MSIVHIQQQPTASVKTQILIFAANSAAVAYSSQWKQILSQQVLTYAIITVWSCTIIREELHDLSEIQADNIKEVRL